MKVIALGLRGVPGVAGGIETHCEQLYPLVAATGVEVELVVRSPYAGDVAAMGWNGIRLRRLWSPRDPRLETLHHSLLGVLYAAVRRPDVLHLHAIGPALFTPLARLLGLTVVVTHHGCDYRRAKWGPVGRWVLKVGERMAMRYAHQVISVSQAGARELEAEYRRKVVVIPNGVPAPAAAGSGAVLAELGLQAGRYVLHVGRAVPEKRQDDLIHAFVAAKLPGWKLALVGDVSGQDAYSAGIRSLAAQHPDVVLAGFRTGDALRALFSGCGCFALPSAIEGFSIALLEALASGCTIVASDIPANHEVELPARCYVPVGDVDALASALSQVPTDVPPAVWQSLCRHVHQTYTWRRVAAQTVRVYREMLPGAVLQQDAEPPVAEPAASVDRDSTPTPDT
jgi:glycosyltransferase involved in cell wall biosynthesis